MPQIEMTKALLLSPAPYESWVVQAKGASTVYYRQTPWCIPATSTEISAGTALTNGQEGTITQPTWFIAKPPTVPYSTSNAQLENLGSEIIIKSKVTEGAGSASGEPRKTFIDEQTFAIEGVVKAGTRPGPLLKNASNETVTLIGVEYSLQGEKEAEATFEVLKNAVAITGLTGLKAKETAASKAPTSATPLVSADALTIKVTAVSSGVEKEPKGLACTLQLERKF